VTTTIHANFRQLSDTTGIYLAGPSDPAPTYCPDLIPAGWQLTGELLDFEIADGWVEVYIMEVA